MNDDADVMHREARNDAVLERLANTPFHGRHEDAWITPPFGDIDELEAGATLEWLDAEHDLPELAGSTALLLVPAMPPRPSC